MVVRTFQKLNVFGVENRLRLSTGSMPCKRRIIAVNVFQAAYKSRYLKRQWIKDRLAACGWLD
jgi:hypothetical protein